MSPTRHLLAALLFLWAVPTWAGNRIQTSVMTNGAEVAPVTERSVSVVRGKTGSQFSLRVRNVSPKRIYIVVAVDSKNTLDGRRSYLGQDGYMLEPGGGVSIPGWRVKKKLKPFTFESARKDIYVGVYGENENPIVANPWTPASGKPKPFYRIKGETPLLVHSTYEGYGP